MSSRKQAVKACWDAINKQRAETNKPQESKKEEQVSEEEHKKRLDMLKQIGILKE